MTYDELCKSGISNRLRILCSNCQWLVSDFEQCREIRKGFTCTKYQIKEEINQLRARDEGLNNPMGWLHGNGTPP